MSNTHITEIMPPDMPRWVWDAMDEGCFARRSIEKVDALQAKIDELMLEYCPEEMTVEQKAEWANHQKSATDKEMKELVDALS
jgi:hypothetical protein